jgi:hypothetical protein
LFSTPCHNSLVLVGGFFIDFTLIRSAPFNAAASMHCMAFW